MTKDKYKALWLSHSSISDFLKCPRTYYLRAVYKDPYTRHKITVMSPPLALGQVVHDVIESLSSLPVDERLKVPLNKKFDVAWRVVSGELGGFKTEAEEKDYKNRGEKMLKNISENPGPVSKKAIKLKTESGLPYYWLSEEENIILSGKIDWLEYLEDEDAVHIIDFKTGKNQEEESSLQLPIYHLLVDTLQKRKVRKASYWYLQTDDKPKEVPLPDLKKAYDDVYEIGKRIKMARQINHFKCPHNGCFSCTPLERVLKGEGKKVGVSSYRQDIYVL